MLRLEFEGYFQMRMATDPDPTDELRGVSGYTFALAGEPDFDAKIHLQPDEPGVWQRNFGPSNQKVPRVGVTVRRATQDGNSRPDLVGARVAFVDAQILEHNGMLVRNDMFIIDPLRVRVSAEDNGDVLLEREDWLNPANPQMPQWEADSQMLLRRQPKRFVTNSPEVAAATGLPDASNKSLIENRKERRKSLEALLKETKDKTEQAALETRIEQLKIVEQWWNLSQGSWNERPIDRRAYTLALQLEGWDIDVNGHVYRNALGGDETRPWPLRFWMGGWDGDALCAYLRGSWEIPLL
ncbi:MAG: hypothetical protein ICV60_03105 [Pyrinomonadaceae bacterium]|nr:hypothetical protein [Pyrinomonadaceae bacterium]